MAGPQLARHHRAMRHDGCGGLAGKAELLTGIEGVSSRPVRRIVLLSTEAANDRGALLEQGHVKPRRGREAAVPSPEAKQ